MTSQIWIFWARSMLFMVCGPQVGPLVDTLIYCKLVKCPTFFKEPWLRQCRRGWRELKIHRIFIGLIRIWRISESDRHLFNVLLTFYFPGQFKSSVFFQTDDFFSMNVIGKRDGEKSFGGAGSIKFLGFYNLCFFRGLWVIGIVG